MTSTARSMLAVGLGGAAGTYLRVALGVTLDTRPGEWPWATLIANLFGTLLLAVVAVRLTASGGTRGVLLPLLGTGVCGALTTFSSMQVETIALWRDSGPMLATAYGAVSIVAGLTIVALVVHVFGRSE